MKAITLRGIDESTYRAIKQSSQEKHTSMNRFLLNLIRTGLGLKAKTKNHSLDQFLGTWTEKQHQDFLANTKSLRNLDKELWR